jgi:superfamily II DNA or RNA helicase
MVSEGVDIPRLRVGVYATNTITELFFRQAVGRLVRWSGSSSRQTAYMFIPDDLRLRTFAAAIAEQRRHSLRRREEEERLGDERPPAEEAGTEVELDAQLSLFAAISAVPLDEEGRPLDGQRLYEEPAGEEIPDLVGAETAPGDLGARPRPVVLETPEPPPLPPPSPQSRRPRARWRAGVRCAS